MLIPVFLNFSLKYEIADRRIIEEKFAYLITETENYKYYALEAYRQACGGTKIYPAIEAFANAVKILNIR